MPISLNVLASCPFAKVWNRVQNSAQEKGLHECTDPAILHNPKSNGRDVEQQEHDNPTLLQLQALRYRCRLKHGHAVFPLSLFIYLGKEVYHIKNPVSYKRQHFMQNQIRGQHAMGWKKWKK